MAREIPPVDYLTVGHITHDLLPDGGYTIGGTAAYAASTAAALERAVGVLTSAGPDFKPAAFDGVATLLCHPAPATTTFENLYINGHREQFVYSMAQPLCLDHVPLAWRQVPLVHIGPIMGECDVTLIEHFSRKAFVGVTPQGWMRTSDEEGRVFPQVWADAASVLPLASAVVLSIEDVGGDWTLLRSYAAQTSILVVTCGWDGGTLFVEGEAYPFPSVPVVEVEPTGAGDIFATAFFIAMASGAPPMAAANYAACLAARSVTRVGLASTPCPADVAVCPLDVSAF